MSDSAAEHDELTRRVIGCAMEVHRTFGNGLQEVIYQRALAHELTLMNIPFNREVEMPIFYKGIHVGTRRVDMLIDEIISVELKALILLENVHLAQARNYLEAYNLPTGLFLNFGARSLEFKRIFTNKYISSK